MTAQEIVQCISDSISSEEEVRLAARVAELTAQGWASPTVQAQSEWQGRDNQIVFGTFAEAVRELEGGGDAPKGVADFDPGEDGVPSSYLAAALATAGEIGTGEPLAYIGVDGYFTLIRAGASPEEIEQAALDCLPAAD